MILSYILQYHYIGIAALKVQIYTVIGQSKPYVISNDLLGALECIIGLSAGSQSPLYFVFTKRRLWTEVRDYKQEKDSNAPFLA